MKNGIILCGGNGTRLSPLTDTTNKALLKVNGKRIIDYPLKTLKDMGVENVVVVLGGDHYVQVVEYLKDGADFGMNFTYVFQRHCNGIAAAINLCERQVSNEDEFVCILGDNFFENPIKWNGSGKAQIVLDYDKRNQESIKRFGVASIRENQNPLHWNILKLKEKPEFFTPHPLTAKLHNADSIGFYPISGCYRFDNRFFEFFRDLKPSARGEFEVIDILQAYLDIGQLEWVRHEKGLWLDIGTHESLKAANEYFTQKENKQ